MRQVGRGKRNKACGPDVADDDRKRPTGAAVTFHHLVPKGSPYFGDDVPDNWVPLCGSGTTEHHGLVEARDPEASRALLEGLSDAEYSYAVEHGGENFFERRYGLRYTRVV